MKCLNLAPIFLAAAVGSMSSAFAGVSGAVVTTVTVLSAPVTYSTTGAKGLSTKVGYEVTIERSGTNTVNNVVFKGGTSVWTKAIPEAQNTLESAEFIEVNGNDSGACKVGAVSTEVVCNFGQLRAGEVRKFAVFFKGPVESEGNCFVPGPDVPACEVVRFAGATNYSEGTGDGTGSFPNDASPFSVDVDLGTNDPTRVKSALSKTASSLLFTGSDGVPTSLTPFRFASKVNIPAPPNNGSGEIRLKKFSLSPTSGTPEEIADEVAQAQLCANAGNFNNCYQADISAPVAIYTVGGTKYLEIILRIDDTEVKANPFKQENVYVYFDSDDVPVPDCDKTTGLPPPNQIRCVVRPITRFGNQGSLGDLRRDVQVVIRAYTNATGYRIR